MCESNQTGHPALSIQQPRERKRTIARKVAQVSVASASGQPFASAAMEVSARVSLNVQSGRRDRRAWIGHGAGWW